MTEKLHRPLETPPRYDKEQGVKHHRELYKRITERLKQEGSPDHTAVKIKAFLFPLLYVFLFLATQMAYSNLWLFLGGYFLMGLFLVIIFLTVIHEVSHDNVFETAWMNQAVLYFFDLMGANSFVWKNRHRLMHHNFPNVNGWDTDIEQSPIFKVFPDAPHSKNHDYQHWLMFLLYPLYLFNWLLIRDFKDFFRKDSMIKKSLHIPVIEYIKLFLFKALYLFYMFVVPMVFFDVSFGNALLGFFLLTLTASIFALSVLLPPHANVSNEFPVVHEGNRLDATWLEHQLATTSDIHDHNWFIAFFMGSFNYHVAHHLYPRISYVHMKQVTEELESYAREHNLNYKKCGFWEALRSHYRLIRNNAIHGSVLEETF